jgi:ABC-type arginine transport system ATPase subunit
MPGGPLPNSEITGVFAHFRPLRPHRRRRRRTSLAQRRGAVILQDLEFLTATTSAFCRVLRSDAPDDPNSCHLLQLITNGYDNIRTRALLLGLSSNAIERLLPEIAEFTELGDYLDMPVRTYSAGMILRLSFAVATCFEPEILPMDESILAGDAHFLSKAEARIDAFIERASVLVLASHNLELSSRWCTKGIWLERGRIREFWSD